MVKRLFKQLRLKLLDALKAEKFYDTSFQAVDMFVVNDFLGEVLLGRKAGKDEYRFLGGFVDPKDESLEQAATREKNEEAGINLECGKPQYLFSQRMDDPRYRNSRHKVMTAMFRLPYVFGFAKGGDDIEEVQWFGKEYLKKNYRKFVARDHWILVRRLIEMGQL
jgi:bifunctional NMN adenylyltransferase/nudix hydrolase